MISFSTCVDHLKILQPGKYEMKMELSESCIDVPAEGGSYSVDLLTNVLQRDLKVETILFLSILAYGLCFT